MPEQITTFDRLLSRVRKTAAAGGKVRAALVAADEPMYVKAIMQAAGDGFLEPILIGAKNSIDQAADTGEVDLGDAAVIECKSRVGAIAEAVRLVAEGKVDLLVRGNITTALMLARLFERPSGLRDGGRHVSHVAVFEHPSYPRLLLMSDGGVTVAPDINQKLAIIQNAVDVANLLGVAMPRVAVLAAVEVINTTMPVTMDAAVISRMVDKGQITNCLIDGPLSMDAATVPHAAEQKGVASKVAGRADIIIAPNIETGNSIYKAMSMFAGAGTAGIIVGARAPIALASRCDSPESIFNSLALGALVSLKKN